MPTTKQEVIDAIDAIDDGGNNTAVEVREVLTKLLDYTENEENQAASLKPFHFKTQSKIDGLNGASLKYSFSGLVNDKSKDLKGQFVNLTFRLKISDNVKDNKFIFELQDDHSEELFAIIQKIVNNNQSLQFVLAVPINISDNIKVNYPFATNIFLFKQTTNTDGSGINKNFINFDIDPFSVSNDGVELSLTNTEVISSISFHAPTNKF